MICLGPYRSRWTLTQVLLPHAGHLIQEWWYRTNGRCTCTGNNRAANSRYETRVSSRQLEHSTVHVLGFRSVLV